MIGHISPEAAEGGTIALIESGDEVLLIVPSHCAPTYAFASLALNRL